MMIMRQSIVRAVGWGDRGTSCAGGVWPGIVPPAESRDDSLRQPTLKVVTFTLAVVGVIVPRKVCTVPLTTVRTDQEAGALPE